MSRKSQAEATATLHAYGAGYCEFSTCVQGGSGSRVLNLSSSIVFPMLLAMSLPHLFSPVEVATKIVIALGIGTLVGLEREWAQKDVGVRTFAITSMAGMLAALLGREFPVVVVISVSLLVILINLRVLLVNRSLEITTSAALIAVALLGILTGEGHTFTPIASAIIITMLLAWKTELTRFAGGLTPQEIRSAVLLGLLGLVIYPLLPNYFIDKWHLLNPRQAWIAVIVLAGMGFVNYVFLRVYSSQGLYYAAALGGWLTVLLLLPRFRVGFVR
jgi:hypothetical protein